MKNFDSLVNTVDISSRMKRRRAVTMIVATLSRIRGAELNYLERIPENLQESDAYSAADESVELLSEAIDMLNDAY